MAIDKRLPEPEIIGFFAGADTPFPPGHKSQRIMEKSYNLEYCFQGKGVLSINNASYPVAAGQCFVTFPDSLIGFEADEEDPWAKSWVCFTGTGVAAFLESLGSTPDNPVFAWQDRPEILDCINSICATVNDTSKSLRVTRFQQAACANRLFALLTAACEEYQPDGLPATAQERYIQQAVRYIDNSVNYITVEDVASHVGLNRAYFATLFKRLTGQTPQQYLIAHRMRRACTLFANPASTASNVAYTLGYDPSPFCRIFKQATGMTPMEYKISLRNR